MPDGVVTSTVSPGAQSRNASPSGESYDILPCMGLISSRPVMVNIFSNPSSLFTTIFDPSCTIPDDVFSSISAFLSSSLMTAIRASTFVCRSFPSWYAKFSDKSPCAIASLSIFAMRGRSSFSSFSSSCLSWLYPSRVIFAIGSCRYVRYVIVLSYHIRTVWYNRGVLFIIVISLFMIPVPLLRRRPKNHTPLFLAASIIFVLFFIIILLFITNQNDTDHQEMDIHSSALISEVL